MIIKTLISLLFFSFLTNSSAFGLCVIKDKVNLRSGPGKKFEKTWEVYKYMPFKKVKAKGAWYKVKDVDGADHWVHKSLVTDKFLCAVVKKDKANLRTGPASTHKKHPSWPQAPQYASFRYLKAKGKWAKIKDSDEIDYWIFRKLIWVQ